MGKEHPSSFNNRPLLHPDLTIAIQAGGKSSRMGTNKAKISFLGRPLILRILERLQILTNKIIIISNNADLDYEELNTIPIYSDLIPGIGPLGGLYTSLKLARTDFVAMIACDMPFASPQLINFELNTMKSFQCDVVIPETDHGLEPMHALYRRETCLPRIEEALKQNERRMISWFPGMKVEVITMTVLAQIEPSMNMFLNINTPEDLSFAESLARD